MLRTPAIAALCTLVLLGVAAPAQADPLVHSSPCAGADSADLDVTAAAATIGCLVNAARVNAGLTPLRQSPPLRAAAQARRQLLLACDVFSHTPCGHRLRDEAAGYAASARAWQVGENLQWRSGGETSPRQVVERWLASPGHRRNMLTARWREHGIAVARDERYHGAARAWLWVQWFGRRQR